MLLRTLIVRIQSTYDDKGFSQASDDVEELGDEVTKTSKATEELDRDLERASKEARGMGQESRKAARSVDKLGDRAQGAGRQVGRLDGLMNKASAAIASLGPAIAAAGLAAVISGVGEAVAFVGEKTAELDAIAKGAQQRGFAVDDYQRLAQVATLSGTNIEALRQREPNNPALRKYAEAGILLSGRMFSSESAAQDGLAELLEQWTERLSLPRLGDFGMTEEDIGRVVANCRGGSMQTNPLALSDDELAALLQQRL